MVDVFDLVGLFSFLSGLFEFIYSGLWIVYARLVVVVVVVVGNAMRCNSTRQHFFIQVFTLDLPRSIPTFQHAFVRSYRLTSRLS